MPKFKGGFGIDNVSDAINADAGDVQVGYDGPVPPPGIYRGRLKRMELTETGPTSKNPGTPMLRMLVEIDDTNEKRKKYNGYGIWNNQTITEKSQGFVNQVIESITGGNAAKAKAVKTWFWKEQINTEKADGGHILAIGKFKINSPEADIPVIVDTKKKRTNEQYPEEGLEIKRWLVPNSDSVEDSDEMDDSEDLGDDDELGGDDFDSDDGLGDDPEF